jgi:hypothetical protein
VVEQSGYRVGCYTSSEFKELFLKNYFEEQENPQYLCSAYRHGDRLYMSFSRGTVIVQPLPQNFS